MGQELWNGAGATTLNIRTKKIERCVRSSNVYSRYRRDLKIQRCADEPRELRHRSSGNSGVGDPPNIVNTASVSPTREFVNNRDSNFLCTGNNGRIGSSLTSSLITDYFTICFIHEQRGFIAINREHHQQKKEQRGRRASYSFRRNWKRFFEGERDCCTLMKTSFLPWSYQILKSERIFAIYFVILFFFCWFEDKFYSWNLKF